MKPKLVGIGKCGSRICYDFFAFVSDLPTAFEVRENPDVSGFSGFLSNFQTGEQLLRLGRSLSLRIRQYKDGLFSPQKIYARPSYVVIDADADNNEVIKWIEFLGSTNDSKLMFPGKFINLAGHSGGCGSPIVSELIFRDWNVPDGVGDTMHGAPKTDIYAVCYSIGGGTGSGAGPVLCGESRLWHERGDNGQEAGTGKATGECHFMNIGVIPETASQYGGHEVPGSENASEIRHLGRFFCSLYGGDKILDQDSNGHSNMTMFNSMWVVGNDCVRILDSIASESDREKRDEGIEGDHEDGGLLAGPSLSTVNFYVSACLTTLCNASSPGTRSEPNLDAIELNSHINGDPFITGAAFRRFPPDERGDILASLKTLVSQALSNISINNEYVSGLSHPVQVSELEPVMQLLDKETNKTEAAFTKALDDFDAKNAPLEFQTARKILVIHGQPESKASDARYSWAKKIITSIFRNAQPETYSFRHSSKEDVLLVLIVDPFIRSVQNAVYTYLESSGLSRNRGDELAELLDKCIQTGGKNAFKALEEQTLISEAALLEFVTDGTEQEHARSIDRNVWDNALLEIIQNHQKIWNEEVSIDRQCVVAALRRLHAMYVRRETKARARSRI